MKEHVYLTRFTVDESFPNSQFNVEGYTIHRQDKSASSGGLILYIRADIAHRRMPKFECNCFGIESICLEVKNGTSKSLITSIYKHPQVSDSTFSSHISDMADKQFLYHDDLTFIGEMNCCPRKSDIIKSFCDIYDLKNLIVSPTCHKGNNPTLLDVILVSKPRRFAKTLYCECILSDFHNFVGAATKKHLPLSEPRRIIYRSYKHFDDDAFINDVSSAPFHVARIFDDVHDASWFTSSLLNDVIDHHAPCKSKLIKCDSVPYMNSKLRKALYKRNMVRNKFRKFGKAYWEENRIHRNNVVSIRKRSIENYFSKNCSRKDKTFWFTVLPFMTDKNNKNGGKIILQEGETTITDNHQIVCDLLASYLSNRHQRVKIQSSRSEWRVLRKGVPQGSILGPLLFNVFINDMFHFMEKCALYNYADDNSMSYASLNVTDVLSCLKRDCDNAVNGSR